MGALKDRLRAKEKDLPMPDWNMALLCPGEGLSDFVPSSLPSQPTTPDFVDRKSTQNGQIRHSHSGANLAGKKFTYESVRDPHMKSKVACTEHSWIFVSSCFQRREILI